MKRIAIAGPSGVGKSTVGSLIAARSSLRFVDLDAEVERVARASIPAIFARGGEAEFRRWESAALTAVAALTDVVLALGGGTVGEGLPRLMAWSRVVLMANAEVLVGRLSRDAVARPMLRGDRALGVRRLLVQREPGWRGFGVWVHTDGVSPERVAARVEAMW